MDASNIPNNVPPDTPTDGRSELAALNSAVEICDTQSALPVRHAAVKEFVPKVLALLASPPASITLAIVDNHTILQLNRKFLAHDWATDVITFPMSDPGDPILCAEIAVSAEMARDQALTRGSCPAQELALYIVHGLLHALGHEDQTPNGIASMRQRESEILTALGDYLPGLVKPGLETGSPLYLELSPCGA